MNAQEIKKIIEKCPRLELIKKVFDTNLYRASDIDKKGCIEARIDNKITITFAFLELNERNNFIMLYFNSPELCWHHGYVELDKITSFKLEYKTTEWDDED